MTTLHSILLLDRVEAGGGTMGGGVSEVLSCSRGWTVSGGGCLGARGRAQSLPGHVTEV